MKIKLMVCVIGIFLASALNAHSREIFLQANKAYEQKEYQKAYDLYQKIEPKGVATWYNMGNASYKLGNYGHALACWQCAQRGASSAEIKSINQNIDVVQDKIGIEQNEKLQSTLWDSLHTLLNKFSLLFLQILVLLSWFLLFYFIKKYNHGKRYTTLMLVLVLTLNVFFILALVLKQYDLQHKGVVMKENISLFAGPNEQFHVLGSLPLAAKVAVIEQQDRWCKIKHETGCGWILSDSIAVL